MDELKNEDGLVEIQVDHSKLSCSSQASSERYGGSNHGAVCLHEIKIWTYRPMQVDEMRVAYLEFSEQISDLRKRLTTLWQIYSGHYVHNFTRIGR